MTKEQKMVTDAILDKDFKTTLVTMLNDAIDIPFINEKTEGKILYCLVDVVENVVKTQIQKLEFAEMDTNDFDRHEQENNQE